MSIDLIYNMLKGTAFLCYMFGSGIIPFVVTVYGKLNDEDNVLFILNS